MDALGKSLVLLVRIAAVICLVPVTSEDADAYGGADGLLLYEVNPWMNSEGVCVYNYGNSPVDLIEYHISDTPTLGGSDEGSISFTESIIIQLGTFVVIAADSNDSCTFVDREGMQLYKISQSGIESNEKFTLVNTGDDVYLFLGDTIIDAVCYRNKLIEDKTLWANDSTVSKKSNVFFQRHGTFDNDTKESWFDHIPGQTNYGFDPDTRFDAVVALFLFPDHGGIPVYDTVSQATELLYINVYPLNSTNMYNLIHEMMLANLDLDVCIFIEGTPVNGDAAVTRCALYLSALTEDSADVKMIGMGSDARYVQDHAKYAIGHGDGHHHLGELGH